jgi:acetyl-CoA C-acetyltransferase
MSREDMDNFAIQSLTRAKQAIEQGHLTAETASVVVKTRAGEVTITDDEQPGKANIEKIPTLRPAFSADGTVTAANSSSISDGASALILASGEAVATHQLTPMARIVGHSTNSRDPSEFTIAPVGAIEKLLARIGWHKDEVDLFEINEAFAMVTMAAIRDLGLDPAKVNIFGGACAQGHPIGSTGSRLIVTLMHALRQQGLKRGVAALCIGGGEATAVAIEMV